MQSDESDIKDDNDWQNAKSNVKRLANNSGESLSPMVSKHLDELLD